MRRYRISTEVLILILENLDPQSLWRACQAFSRIHRVVMEFQALRYRFELALAAMRDGRISHTHGPTLARYNLLLAYKKDWPRLQWSHENKMQVPTPCQMGLSSGFIHRILTNGTHHVLELTELPSYRMGRPLPRTRHVRYSIPPIESVVIDASQELLVMTHLFSQGGLAAIQIHLRNLWTLEKHYKAPAIAYEFSTHSPVRVSNISLQICGSKLGVSMEFVGGKVKHLVMDWRTLHARWFEDNDIMFLHESYMLVITKHHSRPLLNLYNITEMANVVSIREYELPEAWHNSTIGFCSNTSPRSDSAASPHALFYPDPSSRLLLLTVKTPPPPATTSPPSRVWVFVNESYFRPPSRRDSSRVPWKHWGQHVLMRAVPSSPYIRGPHIVGTRVVYLDADPVQVPRSQMGSRLMTMPRLNLIEFRPFSDSSNPVTKAWTVGKRATVFPYETSRDVPGSTVDNLNVDGLRITEDNIVLFMELRQGMRNVNVLTFGAPPAVRRY